MTLVRFSDPKFYYCFRLSLPYFDFDRRWIFFESDFRIQKIILVHQLWIVADDEYTLSPIFEPKIYLSIITYGLSATMDIFCVRFSDPKFFFQSTIYVLHDEYFLSRFFGPQIFFFSPPFIGCGRRWTSFGSDI